MHPPLITAPVWGVCPHVRNDRTRCPVIHRSGRAEVPAVASLTSTNPDWLKPERKNAPREETTLPLLPVLPATAAVSGPRPGQSRISGIRPFTSGKGSPPLYKRSSSSTYVITARPMKLEKLCGPRCVMVCM